MSSPSIPHGRLGVWIGPVQSGKTTSIIDKVGIAMKEKKIIGCCKYAEDIRYDKGDRIITHDKFHVGCIPVHKIQQLPIEWFDPTCINIVFIDEAHFFQDLVEGVKKLLRAGVDVEIVGLLTDYKQDPFQPMLQVLPFASEIHKLEAICYFCQVPSSCSRLKFPGRDLPRLQDRKLIGGPDIWISTCAADACLQD